MCDPTAPKIFGWSNRVANAKREKEGRGNHFKVLSFSFYVKSLGFSRFSRLGAVHPASCGWAGDLLCVHSCMSRMVITCTLSKRVTHLCHTIGTCNNNQQTSTSLIHLRLIGTSTPGQKVMVAEERHRLLSVGLLSCPVHGG